jgi:hypothetical protein
MTLDDLEEMLAEVLPGGFQIETDEDGQLVVLTGLTENEDGEIVSFEGEEEEDLEGEGFEHFDEEDEDEDE